MHVATTKRRYKGKVYINYLIRTSYRQHGKVKHKTLANITHLPADLIELIRRRLKTGKPMSLEGSSIKRSLPHGHVTAVLRTIERIGLERLLAAKRSQYRDIILALIALRIVHPASKLASHKMLCAPATTTLGEQLDLQGLTRDRFYTSLDWLLDQKPRIEKKLAHKHLNKATIVLYDLTSSYYTGRQSELVRYGYNRDGKRGHAQVVFGLICNSEGCPVGMEVFSGNTEDSTTMASQVRKLREQFGVERVVWVGDRGLITGKIIDQQLRSTDGADWITALRSAQIRKLIQQGSVQLSLFDQQDLAEIHCQDYPQERLVACRNPLLADERRQKREQLLQATCRRLDPIVQATRRKRHPLKGKQDIALRVGKVIDQYKMAKHIDLTITDEGFSYALNRESIAAEAVLDGLYVLRTSLPVSSYSAEKTVETYKSLSHVEWAFRSMKTTRLYVRPIHHWLDQRITAHIFLCMLAYYVEWHMRQCLAPILYADDQKHQAKAKRSSVVAPAQKSDAAKKKAATHTTPDGRQVHSMQTVLEYLGTICKNEIQIGDHQQTFDQITEPTEQQEEILRLLKVKL